MEPQRPEWRSLFRSLESHYYRMIPFWNLRPHRPHRVFLLANIYFCSLFIWPFIWITPNSDCHRLRPFDVPCRGFSYGVPKKQYTPKAFAKHSGAVWKTGGLSIYGLWGKKHTKITYTAAVEIDCYHFIITGWLDSTNLCGLVGECWRCSQYSNSKQI